MFCSQALAYATRHLAWSGAAVTTLCQCRFRKLLVGLDDAPAANANVNLQTSTDCKSVAERRAVPTRREYWENICGEEQADIYYPSPSPGQYSPPAKHPCGRAHPQYASADRRRRESRRVGEAHGPSVVRLDASAITSLHLLRGDDDAKDGSVGSLFNYLDATVSVLLCVLTVYPRELTLCFSGHRARAQKAPRVDPPALGRRFVDRRTIGRRGRAHRRVRRGLRGYP